MQRAKVAVVILNWNGRKFLEQFLPSVVAAAGAGTTVYVADNASTDDSLPFLQTHYPQVECISNSGNLGFAAGYNEALQRIEADYYVLLNQDVAVTPGWIDPMIDLMEQDPAIAACQPKIRSWHHPEYFEYAGAAGGWIDRYGYTFCRGRLFKTVEKDHGQYDTPQSIFWASGAALFIRARLYHEAGGLDPDFFAHMEEIDLCWRLQRLGHKIMVCPQSTVYHVGGGSLPQGNPKKVYLNFRNNLILLYKNLGAEERSRKLWVRRMLDGVAAGQSFLGGRYAEVKSIWKAHQSFNHWKARHKNQLDLIPKPPFDQLTGVYADSIVWQYFIEKKKTFTALKTKK